MPSTWLYVGKVIQDRLWRRFKLSYNQELPDPLLFEKYILPVSNIDDLLIDIKLEIETIAISGTGSVPIYTCPKGKRAILKVAYFQQDGGTWTATSFHISDGVSSPTIDRFTAATSRVVPMYQALPLKEDWTVRVYINSFTGAGNLTGGVIVEEEDAYQ